MKKEEIRGSYLGRWNGLHWFLIITNNINYQVVSGSELYEILHTDN